MYDYLIDQLVFRSVLKNLWARNSFDKMNGDIIDIQTDVSATVREAVTNLSVGGGQGM